MRRTSWWRAVYCLLVLVLMVSSTSSWASHIVGGEFNMRHLNANRYRVMLTIYFDNVNGNVGAEDQLINVHLFAKGTNRFITSFEMRLRERNQLIQSTFNNCASSRLQTRVLRYYEDLDFDPQAFSDPRGYYMVYERCCRNNSINNIQNPGGVGQAFYMEFTAMVQNGRRFINSTPELVVPVNDYACVGRRFELPFNATDADGDQLEYELVEPWQGNSNSSPGSIIPGPIPAPYATVRWNAGFSAQNQIPGPVPLDINRSTGRLTVIPGIRAGLFVFAVQVREFRNGQEISLTRREYQLQVQDCPPVPEPRLSVNIPGWSRANSDVIFRTNAAIKVPINLAANFNAALAAQVCVQAIPLNFVPATPLLGSTGCQSLDTNRANRNRTLDLNLPACSQSIPTDPLRIMLIAGIDVCPQPSRDTAYLNVWVYPIPISKPIGRVTARGSRVKVDTLEVVRGEVLPMDLFARTDTTRGPLELRLLYKDSVSQLIPDPLVAISGRDSITSTYDWRADCNLKADAKPLFVLITKAQECQVTESDTTIVHIKLKDPIFQSPQAFTSIRPARVLNDTITVRAGEVVNFTAFALDTTNKLATVRLTGDGFATTTLNGFIGADSARRQVGLPFSYRTSCQDLNTTPRIQILARNSLCSAMRYDTIWMHLRVTLPPDSLPEVTTSRSTVKYDTIRLRAGQSTSFNVIGRSPNQLPTELKGFGTGFSQTAYNNEFVQTSGFGFIETTINYTADCDAATLPPATMRFIVRNDPCRVDQFDTLFVTYVVSAANAPAIFSLEQTEPEIRTYSSAPFTVSSRAYVKAGRIAGTLKVTDTDSTRLSLQLRPLNFSLPEIGLTTETITGTTQLSVPILVQPSCELLGGASSRVFSFMAYALDSLCAPGYRDSARFDLEVFDSASRAFTPPNVITPNNDGVNDTWDLNVLLPPDNCQDQFESLRIYNRYGVLEYETTERNFSWQPKSAPTGAHFWIVKYRKAVYKGWLEVMY